MASTLYWIPISTWVLDTAQAMDAARATDGAVWRKHWVDSYWALGGRSTSGSKGCPRSAAYALWYLGWLKGTARPLLDWPIRRIAGALGKNAAYAVIAAQILARQGFAGSRGALWQRVQREFRSEIGESPAESDQGAVKLTLGLFLDGILLNP